MRRIYYTVKRTIMRVPCLFGNHDIRLSALGWRQSGCIWCKKPVPKRQDLAERCDHHGVDSGGTDYYGTSNPPQESDWNYRYCPKCGEKL